MSAKQIRIQCIIINSIIKINLNIYQYSLELFLGLEHWEINMLFLTGFNNTNNAY